MVLPVRIELTASPFITPALSCPPAWLMAVRGVRALDHPFIVGTGMSHPGTFRCRPSGLYTFPRLTGRAWLGIAVGRTGRFPRI